VRDAWGTKGWLIKGLGASGLKGPEPIYISINQSTKKFMNSISSVTDSPRPGQTHRVATPEATAAVEAIVKENRRITVNAIAAHLDISHGSAHRIVHDVLQFHKYFTFKKLINI
jgi:hypothetical protein